MKFEEHCTESVVLFAKRFEEVHLWLDEFAREFKYSFKHRRVRHHLAGVEEVRKMWGELAAQAAIQHIKSDLEMLGWKEGQHPFPKDEEHYLRYWFYSF